MNAFQCLIAHATDEAAALYLYIYRSGHEQFYTTHEGAYIYLLVLGNFGIAQIHTDATALCHQPGPVKRLSAIGVFISTEAHGTVYTLALLAPGNGTLNSQVTVAPYAVEDKPEAYI